jgi:hypothetical protein
MATLRVLSRATALARAKVTQAKGTLSPLSLGHLSSLNHSELIAPSVKFPDHPVLCEGGAPAIGTRIDTAIAVSHVALAYDCKSNDSFRM